MREIFLTRGKVAVVDDEDYEWLNRWKWHAALDRRSKSGKERWYAVRSFREDNSVKNIGMHREIAACAELPEVDHWDGNGLNNQRHNLRPCTEHQNQCNRRKLSVFSSRFKGVVWNKGRGRWQAQIAFNKRTMYLGLFTDETEAAQAYDAAAKKHFGEFARLNFPKA